MTSLPKHEKFHEGSQQGIKIYGWTITTNKSPISNSREIEKVQKEVSIPLPEMFFGNNSLKLTNDYGILFEFSPLDALKMVDATAEGGEKVKVAYSEEWKKKSAKNHEHIKDVIKPYDWTYTTSYSGTLKGSVDDQVFEKATDRIDMEKLRKIEDILFYDEIDLFEDELADNGTAILNVKIRVMPSGFYILQRFFLRVDEVLFRLNDTRVYHEFGTEYLQMEYSSREEQYNKIKAVSIYKFLKHLKHLFLTFLFYLENT
ncbi:TIP41-like family-domain-containing protein [Glomus cerebriforme]|uniref:TIP41-like family-domain-containing protein n=1 Tax=Glomus cerebriforme TaxID=658196 RepID=A0A397SL75_9GLOM|nr:TIP41-like family-domain-containing protein [Glomus cerebriforme]